MHDDQSRDAAPAPAHIRVAPGVSAPGRGGRGADCSSMARRTKRRLPVPVRARVAGEHRSIGGQAMIAGRRVAPIRAAIAYAVLALGLAGTFAVDSASARPAVLSARFTSTVIPRYDDSWSRYHAIRPGRPR